MAWSISARSGENIQSAHRHAPLASPRGVGGSKNAPGLPPRALCLETRENSYTTSPGHSTPGNFHGRCRMQTDLIEKYNACQEAVVWLREQPDARTAWTTCPR